MKTKLTPATETTQHIVIPVIQPTQANFLSAMVVPGHIPNGLYQATLKTFALGQQGQDNAVEFTFHIVGSGIDTDFVIKKNTLGVTLTSTQIQEALQNPVAVDPFSLFVFLKTNNIALPCRISRNAKGYVEIGFGSQAEEETTAVSEEPIF